MKWRALLPALGIPLLLCSCTILVKPNYWLDSYDYVAKDRTEHFEIYLEHEYGSAFRQDIQAWLEEVYDKVGALFDTYPEDRTIVKIYSSPLITGDRYEYYGYAGTEAIYTKKFPDIRRNLVHEYTHYVAARAANRSLPSWFNEGLATFVSNHLDRQDRPTLEMEIFRFAHGDFLHNHSTSGPVSISKLPARSTSIRQRYAYGSSFMSYIVEEHGFDIILETLQTAEKDGGIPQALSRAIGIPFEEIDLRWRRFLDAHSDPLRYDKYGPIRDWHVIGPFDNVDGRGFWRPHAIEEGVDLSAGYPIQGQVVRWRKYRSNHPTGAVDLRQCEFSPSRYVIAYAATTVRSPSEMDVEIWAGGDDTLTLWLNGEVLISRHEPRTFRPDTDRAEGTLLEGENTILVKVCQSSDRWKFGVRITDREGRQIPGLKVVAGSTRRD